jgi:hypothetical protein
MFVSHCIKVGQKVSLQGTGCSNISHRKHCKCCWITIAECTHACPAEAETVLEKSSGLLVGPCCIMYMRTPLWSQNTVAITLPVDLTVLHFFNCGDVGVSIPCWHIFSLGYGNEPMSRLLWQCTPEILNHWQNIVKEMTGYKPFITSCGFPLVLEACSKHTNH